MLGSLLLGSSPTASCRGVGSGRRFGLKNRWGKPRAGSSPAPGTSDSISDSQVSPLKSNCYRRSPTEEYLLTACRMGMKPRGPENRRTWSPDLAYIVGLLAPDGNLSPDGRHICFVSRDLQLIQTLASILHLNNRVGIKLGGYAPRPVFQIAFGDRLFYERRSIQHQAFSCLRLPAALRPLSFGQPLSYRLAASHYPAASRHGRPCNRSAIRRAGKGTALRAEVRKEGFHLASALDVLRARRPLPGPQARNCRAVPDP